MDRKQLEYIVIGFENVENIMVSAENVATFMFDKIVESRAKSWYTENCYISKMAYSSCIVLRPEANVEIPDWQEEITVFNRILKFHDITDVELVYDNKTSEYISVRWDDGEYSNGYQTSKLTEDNHLVIVIDSESTAERKCNEMNSKWFN